MVSVPMALGSTASASTAVDLFTDANPRIGGQHVHTMPVPFVSDRPRAAAYSGNAVLPPCLSSDDKEQVVVGVCPPCSG